MKKFKYFIILSVLLLLNAPVFADVMPYYTSSLSKETIGFLQVPNKFSLYSFPRNDSPILENVAWSNTEVILKNKRVEPSETFAVLIKNSFAFCMVIDSQDGWYKIVYDKTNGKSGWIKPEKEEDFWSLRDFYSFYGKKYGLYYMKNIDYRKRGIYGSPESGNQKIGSFSLIKSIYFNKLSGNWALVTVKDMDKYPKIGYIQWRENDGTIVVFPKFEKAE